MRFPLQRSIFSRALSLAPVLLVSVAMASRPAVGEPAAKQSTFSSVARSDAEYKKALDAHDFAPARSRVGKRGAFHGTVLFVHRPNTGGMVILQFDKIRTHALSAVLQQNRLAAFPNLWALQGKEILVTGRFILQEDSPALEITKPEDVRTVR